MSVNSYIQLWHHSLEGSYPASIASKESKLKYWYFGLDIL